MTHENKKKENQEQPRKKKNHAIQENQKQIKIFFCKIKKEKQEEKYRVNQPRGQFSESQLTSSTSVIESEIPSENFKLILS